PLFANPTSALACSKPERPSLHLRGHGSSEPRAIAQNEGRPGFPGAPPRVLGVKGALRGPLSSTDGFALEEPTLALHAPAIARQAAVMTDDPMTGNRDRDRVRRARARHRADGLRRADTLRQLRIGRGAPGGDLAQCLPDALLECRAAHVQRQVEAQPGRLDEADDLRDESLELPVAADHARVGESTLKVTRERIGLVA